MKANIDFSNYGNVFKEKIQKNTSNDTKRRVKVLTAPAECLYVSVTCATIQHDLEQLLVC